MSINGAVPKSLSNGNCSITTTSNGTNQINSGNAIQKTVTSVSYKFDILLTGVPAKYTLSQLETHLTRLGVEKSSILKFYYSPQGIVIQSRNDYILSLKKKLSNLIGEPIKLQIMTDVVKSTTSTNSRYEVVITGVHQNISAEEIHKELKKQSISIFKVWRIKSRNLLAASSFVKVVTFDKKTAEFLLSNGCKLQGHTFKCEPVRGSSTASSINGNSSNSNRSKV